MRRPLFFTQLGGERGVAFFFGTSLDMYGRPGKRLERTGAGWKPRRSIMVSATDLGIRATTKPLRSVLSGR